MKMTVTIIQHGQKMVTRETEINHTISHADMKKLWEAEQALNSVPGSKLRFHINLL